MEGKQESPREIGSPKGVKFALEDNGIGALILGHFETSFPRESTSLLTTKRIFKPNNFSMEETWGKQIDTKQGCAKEDAIELTTLICAHVAKRTEERIGLNHPHHLMCFEFIMWLVTTLSDMKQSNTDAEVCKKAQKAIEKRMNYLGLLITDEKIFSTDKEEDRSMVEMLKTLKSILLVKTFRKFLFNHMSPRTPRKKKDTTIIEQSPSDETLNNFHTLISNLISQVKNILEASSGFLYYLPSICTNSPKPKLVKLCQDDPSYQDFNNTRYGQLFHCLHQSPEYRILFNESSEPLKVRENPFLNSAYECQVPSTILNRFGLAGNATLRDYFEKNSGIHPLFLAGEQEDVLKLFLKTIALLWETSKLLVACQETLTLATQKKELISFQPTQQEIISLITTLQNLLITFKECIKEIVPRILAIGKALPKSDERTPEDNAWRENLGLMTECYKNLAAAIKVYSESNEPDKIKTALSDIVYSTDLNNEKVPEFRSYVATMIAVIDQTASACQKREPANETRQKGEASPRSTQKFERPVEKSPMASSTVVHSQESPRSSPPSQRPAPPTISPHLPRIDTVGSTDSSPRGDSKQASSSSLSPPVSPSRRRFSLLKGKSGIDTDAPESGLSSPLAFLRKKTGETSPRKQVNNVDWPAEGHVLTQAPQQEWPKEGRVYVPPASEDQIQKDLAKKPSSPTSSPRAQDGNVVKSTTGSPEGGNQSAPPIPAKPVSPRVSILKSASRSRSGSLTGVGSAPSSDSLGRKKETSPRGNSEASWPAEGKVPTVVEQPQKPESPRKEETLPLPSQSQSGDASTQERLHASGKVETKIVETKKDPAVEPVKKQVSRTSVRERAATWGKTPQQPAEETPSAPQEKKEPPKAGPPTSPNQGRKPQQRPEPPKVSPVVSKTSNTQGGAAKATSTTSPREEIKGSHQVPLPPEGQVASVKIGDNPVVATEKVTATKVGNNLLAKGPVTTVQIETSSVVITAPPSKQPDPQVKEETSTVNAAKAPQKQDQQEQRSEPPKVSSLVDKHDETQGNPTSVISTTSPRQELTSTQLAPSSSTVQPNPRANTEASNGSLEKTPTDDSKQEQRPRARSEPPKASPKVAPDTATQEEPHGLATPASEQHQLGTISQTAHSRENHDGEEADEIIIIAKSEDSGPSKQQLTGDNTEHPEGSQAPADAQKPAGRGRLLGRDSGLLGSLRSKLGKAPSAPKKSDTGSRQRSSTLNAPPKPAPTAVSRTSVRTGTTENKPTVPAVSEKKDDSVATQPSNKGTATPQIGASRSKSKPNSPPLSPDTLKRLGQLRAASSQRPSVKSVFTEGEKPTDTPPRAATELTVEEPNSGARGSEHDDETLDTLTSAASQLERGSAALRFFGQQGEGSSKDGTPLPSSGKNSNRETVDTGTEELEEVLSGLTGPISPTVSRPLTSSLPGGQQSQGTTGTGNNNSPVAPLPVATVTSGTALSSSSTAIKQSGKTDNNSGSNSPRNRVARVPSPRGSTRSGSGTLRLARFARAHNALGNDSVGRRHVDLLDQTHDPNEVFVGQAHMNVTVTTAGNQGEPNISERERLEVVRKTQDSLIITAENVVEIMKRRLVQISPSPQPAESNSNSKPNHTPAPPALQFAGTKLNGVCTKIFIEYLLSDYELCRDQKVINDPSKAKPGCIYMTERGDYYVQNPNGVVVKGSIPIKSKIRFVGDWQFIELDEKNQPKEDGEQSSDLNNAVLKSVVLTAALEMNHIRPRTSLSALNLSYNPNLFVAHEIQVNHTAKKDKATIKDFPAAIALSEYLKKESSLQTLSLAHCQLVFPANEENLSLLNLMNGLRENESVELLDLSYCSLDDSTANWLYRALKKHPKLCVLLLEGNEFQNPEMSGKLLLKLVRKNPRIIEINLQNTNLPATTISEIEGQARKNNPTPEHRKKEDRASKDSSTTMYSY